MQTGTESKCKMIFSELTDMKISLYKWFGTYMDTWKSVIFYVLTFIFLWKHKKDLLSKQAICNIL